MEGWWVRYPEAFQAEKDSLDASGWSWEIDEGEFNEGRLVIHLKFNFQEKDLTLIAEYPDSYPYFSPQVLSRESLFARHQNPVTGGLCFLAAEGEDWVPIKDTLVSLIKDQLPEISISNDKDVDQEKIAESEDHVGEALSSFLFYAPNSAIIVPDETPSPEHMRGSFELKVRESPEKLSKDEPLFLNGMVKKIKDERGATLVEFPPEIPAFTEEINGFWVRYDRRPPIRPGFSHEKYFAESAKRDPRVLKAVNKAKVGDVILVGFVYPDELSWRTSKDDWVFLALRIVKRAQRSESAHFRSFFVRSDWGGEESWLKRAPELRPLRDKSVLLVGLGSLGSPVALNLAKSGIQKIHLVDCDHLQTGNTIRWALGWEYAGIHKSGAIKAYVDRNYPFTLAEPVDLRIGGCTRDSVTDQQYFASTIREVDLVIDASASYRVNHFVSDLALQEGVDYLWLTTTHGAAGGVVGRVKGNRNQKYGCWHCFQRGLAEGVYRLPSDSGAEGVQPGGCAQATFIGAGIDSDVISSLATRLAVATLCESDQGGYPDFGWNVAVADTRRDGQPLAPEWSVYDLLQHAECKVCGGDG